MRKALGFFWFVAVFVGCAFASATVARAEAARQKVEIKLVSAPAGERSFTMGSIPQPTVDQLLRNPHLTVASASVPSAASVRPIILAGGNTSSMWNVRVDLRDAKWISFKYTNSTVIGSEKVPAGRRPRLASVRMSSAYARPNSESLHDWQAFLLPTPPSLPGSDSSRQLRKLQDDHQLLLIRVTDV
jgi:hypothetical protein